MSTPTQRKASKEATTSGMGSVKSTSRYNYSFYIYIQIQYCRNLYKI